MRNYCVATKLLSLEVWALGNMEFSWVKRLLQDSTRIVFLLVVVGLEALSISKEYPFPKTCSAKRNKKSNKLFPLIFIKSFLRYVNFAGTKQVTKGPTFPTSKAMSLT